MDLPEALHMRVAGAKMETWQLPVAEGSLLRRVLSVCREDKINAFPEDIAACDKRTLFFPHGCGRDDIAADRPLRVLDVSCGAGLSAIAGARSGHNVQGFSVGVLRVSISMNFD